MQKNQFTDFEYLAYWETEFIVLVSINVFCVWIKLLKYVSFNVTMTQLSRTLSRVIFYVNIIRSRMLVSVFPFS
jgi:polycystin 2L1